MYRMYKAVFCGGTYEILFSDSIIDAVSQAANEYEYEGEHGRLIRIYEIDETHAAISLSQDSGKRIKIEELEAQLQQYRAMVSDIREYIMGYDSLSHISGIITNYGL